MKRVLCALLALAVFLTSSGVSGISAEEEKSDALNHRKVYLPLILKNYPLPPYPGWTKSYYVDDLRFLPDVGRALGIAAYNTPRAQDWLVVLDLGYPGKSGSIWGAWPIFVDGFFKESDIREAVRQMARNFWIYSSRDKLSQLTIGVGVNNSSMDLALAVGHGKAWALMVNSIVQGAANYSSQVTIVGASDMELTWNDPYTTERWEEEYIKATTCVPGDPDKGCLLDFGNAVCNVDSDVCENGWNYDEVAYKCCRIGKGNPHIPYARPVPEIYNINGYNARQWADVANFVREQYGETIRFVGVMTQKQRCPPGGPQPPGCEGADNSPEEGWRQLRDEIVKPPLEQLTIRWSTDITRTYTYPSVSSQVEECEMMRNLVLTSLVTFALLSGCDAPQPLPPEKAIEYLTQPVQPTIPGLTPSVAGRIMEVTGGPYPGYRLTTRWTGVDTTDGQSVVVFAGATANGQATLILEKGAEVPKGYPISTMECTLKLTGFSGTVLEVVTTEGDYRTTFDVTTREWGKAIGECDP
ncbi:hypothetical protein A2716_02710 [candidate division WWE3 bacterium RIFCSPHIGHO2_01_FULL_40_23]|uniref:Uncharacterized protein n=1 Tax=candidate division WWE3 bacterium RIFCSPLOWO2_01_FULL_41_18 TaxID=1802625 RepID=A0A1F4VF72_UNCKA|nr:MAG: hypothetical protein A2716_02710 [candidate division WWE3 bacterium RIFCSPHIGHO2_01_FULL_40_23]OGC55896.1 MAG: hypothetical protein A3A78_02560 [candidate division WWE3 bacterium RIFCSPLOWO2_01_FULL_41_18]